MKISAHFYTAIPDRIGYVLKIIYSEFLRYHINDLVAGRDIGFILVCYQLINFLLFDFIIR